MKTKKAVAIVSGGMDSAVLAYLMKSKGYEMTLVSFNYGQKHLRELQCAKEIARAIGATNHHLIDLSAVGGLLQSALTTEQPVPDGKYSEEVMRQTVVPNRNTIMLSIAWGIACSINAELLCCGVHSGDHFIYPDCRPDYLDALNNALRLGTEGHRNEELSLFAPLTLMDKAAIVRLGSDLGVPFVDTWTCYKGQDVACGTCGSCDERLEAFALAGLDDPISYLTR